MQYYKYYTIRQPKTARIIQTQIMNDMKDWKQELKVTVRKVDGLKRDVPKLFLLTSSQQPLSEKIVMMLMEAEHSDIRLQKQQAGTITKLQGLKKGIDELRQTVKYFEHTNEFLVKVQSMSEGIFNKMQTFKGKMADSYDQLQDLQDKLFEQLALHDKKIQGIEEGNQPPLASKNISNQQNRALNRQHKDKKIQENKAAQKEEQLNNQEVSPIAQIDVQMKDKEEECQTIEGQIRQLGKNLGWVEEDHHDFLSIWNRGSHKNYFQIQEQLLTYFSLYTQQQVKEHMNKYMKWKKLIQQKKQVIYQYKLLKQERKSEELKNVALVEKEEKDIQKTRQQQIRIAEQQRLRKEQVQQWKLKKQQEKNKKQHETIELERRRKDQHKQHRIQDQLQRKQMLQQWKHQQNDKRKSAVQSSIRKRPSSAINKETEERIREREEKLVNEKMQRVLQKKVQQEQIEKKKEELKQKNYVKFSHVAPKFEENTVAMKEKKRQKWDGKERKDAETFAGKLLMSGRAVPQWRQGL